MRLTRSNIDDFPRFCFAPKDFMVVDSLCFFSGDDIETLVNLLNSEYATWYFLTNVATLDNGGFQMRQQYVEEIPLPRINNIQITNIDSVIYKNFHFNNSEITLIKDSIDAKKQEIIKTISKR